VKTNHSALTHTHQRSPQSLFSQVIFVVSKICLVHIYVDSHILGLYITLQSKLYCSEVISIYIQHFER